MLRAEGPGQGAGPCGASSPLCKWGSWLVLSDKWTVQQSPEVHLGCLED